VWLIFTDRCCLVERYYYYYYFFLTPVLSSQGMKKLSYAKKNQAGMAITPRPPSQSYHEVEWH